jgi:hypothetical protein
VQDTAFLFTRFDLLEHLNDEVLNVLNHQIVKASMDVRFAPRWTP